MQVEIIYRTENSASYEVEKLNIEPSELDIDNIKKAMEILKVNPFISSIRISTNSNVEYLNEEDEEVNDWRVDVEEWIVFKDSFLFYCQSKWDSSDQMESNYLNVEQFEN